ncbi:MAG: HDOD domain-containing protein [Deltaproteobacteria bacterium]|nr:HDOD domain-containing protein [Deltaproteobacteria bacterium]
MKRRILFVDDEPMVIQGLQRMLRGMRGEWEMTFVQSGAEALDVLSKKPFDVIVTDMRMPGMDGADLLNRVMDQYPWIVRIVLSGQSDQKMILKSALPTHQFLSKPCDPDVLKTTVARACAWRDVVANEAVQEAVAKIKSLPALPDKYVEITRELESETSSASNIGRIIAQDVGMTADILKMVNSSFFGFVRHVSSPEEAVALLGIDVVKSLVLTTHLMTAYDCRQVRNFSLQGLWRHCLATAAMARQIAKTNVRDQKFFDQAFIAGLLHDVGKLVLAYNLPDKYNLILDQVRAENRLVWEVEGQVLGTSHAEVGGYLLGLWGLPDSIVGAVVFHHDPSTSLDEDFTPLTAVHVADFLEHELVRINEDYARPEVDADYLAGLGLIDRLPEWRSLCLEQVQRGEKNE